MVAACEAAVTFKDLLAPEDPLPAGSQASHLIMQRRSSPASHLIPSSFYHPLPKHLVEDADLAKPRRPSSSGFVAFALALAQAFFPIYSSDDAPVSSDPRSIFSLRCS
jgi:hypothetical protein